MRPQAHFKKAKSNNKKTVIATIKIVLTFLAIAVFGMIFYFVATQGWEAVFAWFGGKWFCMVVMVVIAAGTLAMWLFTLVKSMKARLGEDE